MFDAANKTGPHPLDRSGEFDRIESLGQLSKHRLQFKPREVGAQAIVFANAKGQVRVRLAADIEPVRIFKNFIVAIGRWIKHSDDIALEDLLAVQLRIRGRDAAELDYR